MRCDINNPIGIRVELGDVTVSVFFEPFANFGVEALQVFPRPL